MQKNLLLKSVCILFCGTHLLQRKLPNKNYYYIKTNAILINGPATHALLKQNLWPAPIYPRMQ